MPTPYTHIYSPLTYVGSKRTTVAKPTPDTVPQSPIQSRLEEFYNVIDLPLDGTAKIEGEYNEGFHFAYRRVREGAGTITVSSSSLYG